MLDAVGILGALLIIVAWAMELLDEINKRKNLLELRFSILSLVGTGMLLYYSYVLGNTVFQFLNLGILLVIVFEILYTIYIVKLS